MNTQKLSKNKNQVYSTSGFKDTLASPIFYPVIVVAVILGVTSIFGFLQNPLKLKSMVSVIHQKVATSNVVNDSFKNNQYTFEKGTQSLSDNTVVVRDIERVAFNYNIASESFWTDLDASNFESATEEMERKEREAVIIGAPLEIDTHENQNSESNILDDSIYALNNKT